MAESLKQKTFKGTIWSAIEAFSYQGIQFIIMLVMARILSPSDYGILGMLGVFIAVSGALINCNFGTALIRKLDRTEVDNSTVFYFNFIMSIVFYFILFFSAPLIADFYNEPILIPVTRIISLKLIIQATSSIQSVNYTQRLDFKTQAKASLTAGALSGIVGIICAYYGMGVWALVVQQLVSAVLGNCILWYNSSWRPIWAFSFTSLKELFGFSSKLLISGLIHTLYINIYPLVIGKVYMASDLGFYTRAQGFSSFASNSLMSIIQRVTFPVLCNIQKDETRLAEGYRRILKVTSFIIFPIMIGMAAVAKPMVLTLIGEKWLYAAVLLVPICLGGMWYPVHSINLNLLQVKGRSDLFLRLEIIKKVLGISVLFITIPLGLYAMCWGVVCNSIIALLINTHYTGKLINLGFLKQMKDLAPTILLSAVMGVTVWLTLAVLPLPQPVLLTIGVIEGAIIYLLGAKLFRFPELDEIRSLIKRNRKSSKEATPSLEEGVA